MSSGQGRPNSNNGDYSTYQTRRNEIRNPELNRMARTRVRFDKYIKKNGVNDEIPKGTKRKKAFAGAFVANPKKQVPSGFVLAGILMKHIHDFVIDMDLTSLYPSIMILMNLSNETFFGKLTLKNPENFKIPIYPSFIFHDKERDEYKQDPSNFFMENLADGHYTIIGNMFMGLPMVKDILDYIESHIDEFKK